jgi:hypothetical protein
MRRSAVAGFAAGLALAVGGVVAIDTITDSADAQRTGPVTRAELNAANDRSIAAIKRATRVWNLVGVHVANPGELVRVRGPVIPQRRGIGGGIPNDLLAGGAPPAQPGAPGASAMLSAVVLSNGSFSRGSAGTTSANVGAGSYTVVFDRDVTNCTFTVSAGGAGNVPTSGIASASRRAGNPNAVRVRTRLTDGTIQNRPFHLMVHCP